MIQIIAQGESVFCRLIFAVTMDNFNVYRFSRRMACPYRNSSNARYPLKYCRTESATIKLLRCCFSASRWARSGIFPTHSVITLASYMLLNVARHHSLISWRSMFAAASECPIFPIRNLWWWLSFSCKRQNRGFYCFCRMKNTRKTMEAEIRVHEFIAREEFLRPYWKGMEFSTSMNNKCIYPVVTLFIGKWFGIFSAARGMPMVAVVTIIDEIAIIITSPWPMSMT